MHSAASSSDASHLSPIRAIWRTFLQKPHFLKQQKKKLVSIFSKDVCVITYSFVLKTEFTACSVSFFMEMKKSAVVQYMKKMIAAASSRGKDRVEFQLCSREWRGGGRDAVTVKGSGDAG